MAEQPTTCGQGIAENAALPAKLGELTGALAAIFEAHTMALDPTDEDGRAEYAAYAKLATEHRQIAAQLQALAGEMAGYRDLPMARHDMGVMSSPRLIDPFRTFVAIEQDLLDLLRTRVERNRTMLAAMTSAPAV
jgi:hypothetical protein